MNGQPSRREFIKNAALLPLAGTAAITACSACGQNGPKHLGVPRLKLSLHTFSFNQALIGPKIGGKPAITLMDLLDFCALHEFDAIDPMGYYFPGYPDVPSNSAIASFKRKAFQLGIEIASTGVRTNFAQSDREQRALDVKLVKDWINVAVKLGAPVIRVFAGKPQDEQNWLETAKRMATELRECVTYGEECGVMIGIQNHNGFLKSASQALEFVKLLDSNWCGVIVDSGNFLQDDPYEEIRKLSPSALYILAKDNMKSPEGYVSMDAKKFVSVIRDTGYRGYLSIETVKVSVEEYDPLVTVPKFVKEIRNAISSE